MTARADERCLFCANEANPHHWRNRQNKKKSRKIIFRDFLSAAELADLVLNEPTRRGGELVTLKDELDNINSYIYIYNCRYGNQFTLETDLDSGLLELQVVKFILQPIVENAIYHGIKNRRGKGKILIEGREEGDALVLTVSDNGQGMTPERLHEVQEAIRTGKRAGFGLAAVAERILLYYGPGYGMQISSEEGKGTIIEIRLGKNIQPKS